MLYFTGEVFHRLANQNRGHIRVMLELEFQDEVQLYQVEYLEAKIRIYLQNFIS